MGNDSALTALALVERCLLEDGDGIQAIATVTPQEELGELASSLAIILAASLQADHGLSGAIEKVHHWRGVYLAGAQQ